MDGGVRMTTALKAPAQGAGAPPDRVRAHSNSLQNQRIDAQTQQCLQRHASADREVISRHIDALNREWDVERYLQMNAGLVSLSGVLLGGLVNRRFLLLPAAVFGFFFQHATQGWCPPLPVFRRMGVRTRREVNKEKYALKALRGDFNDASLERQSDQEER
jgi:hypothetical protein